MSDFKEKLMSALETAINHFNSGLSPTDAVIKTAKDNSFNVDQACRLGETFNSARTLYHFKKYAGTDNKSANFELCNNDAVVLKLFNQPKIKEASFDIPDYSFYEERPRNKIAVEMTFNDNSVEGLNLDNQFARANRIVNTQKSLAKHAEDVVNMLSYTVGQQLDKVANILKAGYEDISIDRTKRLFASYKNNNDAKEVLDLVYTRLPVNLQKTAKSHDFDNYPVVDDRDLKDIKQLIDKSIEYKKQAILLSNEKEELNKTADDFNKEMTKAAFDNTTAGSGGPLDDFFTLSVKTAAAGDPGGGGRSGGGGASREWQAGDELDAIRGAFDKDMALTTQLANPMTAGVKSIFSEAMPKGLISEMFLSIDPDKQIKLKKQLENTERSMLLTDLVVNDKVLREVDPDEISEAYLAFVNIAPEASRNKSVVRAVLRGLVHTDGTISPFDAEQYAKFEKLLREQQNPLPQIVRA